MKSNHTFANKCLSAVLTILMVTMPFTLTGCGAPELIADINVAQEVAQSAGNILSASNPEAGAKLEQAAATLGELSKLVGQYDAAVAAGKPGIATQIQAITGTLTNNLSDILATVRVKNPELVEYITVAVAIGNSVVTTILAHLPANAGTVQAQAAIVAQSQALPTVPFKSHKDLKNAWNNKVKAAYPGAKI